MRIVRSIFAVVLLLTQIGCATIRISHAERWNPTSTTATSWRAPNDAYTTPLAATDPERRTVWVFMWGWLQKNIDTPNCVTGRLAEVKVSTNFAFACVTVLSLGFVQPVTVEWRCAKQSQLSTSGL